VGIVVRVTAPSPDTLPCLATVPHTCTTGFHFGYQLTKRLESFQYNASNMAIAGQQKEAVGEALSPVPGLWFPVPSLVR
jgi:hypothetical protein